MRSLKPGGGDRICLSHSRGHLNFRNFMYASRQQALDFVHSGAGALSATARGMSESAVI
jgi:hypothetical protein